MNRRISFLRHGATTAGRRYCGSTDVPLSAEGWQQLWHAVDQRRWDRIISSPLKRCAEFADALATRLGIPWTPDLRWRELHFGDWETRSAEELMVSESQALTLFWQNPVTHPPPNAEPLADLQARVLQAWVELAGRESNENLLVVTHGGPIRVILGALAQQPLESLSTIEVAHAQLIDTLDETRGESWVKTAACDCVRS